MKYYLVIKAESASEARQAARDNGIIVDLEIVDKHAVYDEVYATVDGVPIEALQLWYTNPLMSPVVDPINNMGPFPYGTLLFFNIAQ